MQLEFGGQRVSVAAGQLLVGSDLAAAVRLAGDDVLPSHAFIRSAGEGSLIIEPAVAGARFRVNGVASGHDPTPLLHGDRIGIGTHELVVVDPARAGATQMMARIEDVATRTDQGAHHYPPNRVEATCRLVCLTDGREYRVDVAPFVLGRDATAQVVIGSPDASRKHAEIVSSPDGDVLVDLSANGTYVNGSRIDGRHRLKALDVIRIGAEEFRFYPLTAPRPAAAPAGAEFRLGDTLMGVRSFKAGQALPGVPVAPRPLAALLTKSGALKGQRFTIATPVTNVGRGEYNEIRLPDASVSSGHAKLQLKEGVWTITDLGSTNGTWVDDERVDQEAPLSPGAIIKLGDVALSFEPKDERPTHPERTAVLASPPLPQPPPSAKPEEPVAPPRRLASTPPGVEVPRPAPQSNTALVVLAILVLIAALAAIVWVG